DRRADPLGRAGSEVSVPLVISSANEAGTADNRRPARPGVVSQRDRPLRAVPPTAGGTLARARGREGDATAARDVRPHRSAPHAGGDRRFSCRRVAASLRGGGRSTAGFTAVRRADDRRLAG